MEYSAGRTKLATVALVTVGFALGFAEFIVIGITPDIADIYNNPLSDGQPCRLVRCCLCGVDADYRAFDGQV